MLDRIDGEGAPGEGLRDAALAEIDAARAVLRDGGLPMATRVHETRKYLKKVRALLRLLRRPAGHRARSARHRLRAAGRHLSESRDATVIRAAFDELHDAGIEAADSEVLAAIAEWLRAQAERAEADGANIQAAVATVDLELAEVRDRIAGWNLDNYRLPDLAAACAWTYRRARRALRRLRGHTDAARAHEWRKRVKEHWYHMRLLDHPRAAAVEPIGELLGRANDLAVLGEHLRRGEHRDAALERAVEQARSEAVEQARALGRELFSMKARAFGGMLLESL